MKITKYTYRTVKKITVLILCEWILLAWKDIPGDNIMYDFKTYCFSSNLNGSEDDSFFDSF